MSDGKEQFLPNDQTMRVVFKPNSRVLDCRGRWAKELADLLHVEHWVISENTITLSDEARTRRFVVGFNQVAITCIDTESADAIHLASQMVLDYLALQPEFGTSIFVNRLGVSHRFCTPFNQGFA